MSLEICRIVASSNTKTSEFLKVIRIKDNLAMATGMGEVFRMKNLPFQKIDCTVDAEEFMKVYKKINNSEVSQINVGDNAILKIKAGSFKAEIPCSSIDFPYDIDEDDPTEDQGEVKSVAPGNFVEAVSRIASLLKISSGKKIPIGYIIGNFIYVTDGVFLVRTPLVGVDLGGTAHYPITISPSFASALVEVKKQPIDIRITERSITVTFEDCFLQSMTRPPQSSNDFEKMFTEISNTETKGLPEDVGMCLEQLVSFADKDDKVIFNIQGVTLMKDGKATYQVSCNMPAFMIRAKTLQSLLEYGTEFNMDSPKRIIFKGKDLEGLWAVVQTSEEKEEAAPAEPAKKEKVGAKK